VATPETSFAEAATALPKQGTRSILAASAVGTVIEYFELTAYTFLLVYFAPLFFPSDNAAASTLSAVATLGVAYVVRPFAAVMWGWIADKKGRRTVLVSTIVLMGIASLGMGLLPTFAHIGLAAPILLVLLRACQGISAAGEGTTAAAYIIESSPQQRRGWFGSVVPSFSLVGYGLGALVAGLLTFTLTPAQMSDFGWRIPFIVCSLLTIVVLYMRRRMEESPEFAAIESTDEVAKSPFIETVRLHWRAVLKAMAITVGSFAPVFVLLIFIVGLLIQTRHIPSTVVFVLMGLGLLWGAVTGVIGGILADRFGRRPVVIVTTVGLIVGAVPMLMVLSQTSSVPAIAGALFVLFTLQGPLYGVAFTLLSEWFPAKVRATGSALGANIGAAIAGGVAPVLTLQLTTWTGSNTSPAFWIILTSAALLGVTWFSRETRNLPLPR
jgi:MHS family proline/betaine transporter-like MFS transporter